MDALSIMQSYDVLVVIEAILEKGIFFASKFTDYIQSQKPILTISPPIGFAADLLKGSTDHYFADNTDSNDIYLQIKRIKDCKIKKGLKSNKLYSSFIPSTVIETLKKLCFL